MYLKSSLLEAEIICCLNVNLIMFLVDVLMCKKYLVTFRTLKEYTISTNSCIAPIVKYDIEETIYIYRVSQ